MASRAATTNNDYALVGRRITGRFPAPKLPYQPRDPKHYKPGIGFIGCGGISETHLRAYRAAGYRVVALCDLKEPKAERRRKEFFPKAALYVDYRELLDRADIEVIDIATHTIDRPPIVEAALRAGKHVLSQKPFVSDLATGRRLAELARRQKRLLAVNQNGRWAPHFGYMREAVWAGLIGELTGVNLAVHWDHTWVAGTRFDDMRHLVLNDFAIHWLDFLTTCMRERQPRRVFASIARSAGQVNKAALLGQVIVEYEDAQATLCFHGDTKFGPRDESTLVGTHGTIVSSGTSISDQRLRLLTERGEARPTLVGSWFPDGFHGTMAELLSAVEEGREPMNSAADNLRSLALCFAAVASAERGKPVVPGSVERLLAQ
ncbi:MAG TPA: Gfo/Idh/MocA family oxidoreductase [Pirellulales bacterium]|nr:Gfo/Idh/MocA family oxidoreductase [Pirellulales bacterium]